MEPPSFETVDGPIVYPELYLEGIRLFNEEEFFECHEVLEDLWAETMGPEKKFYQGLIQTAVALFHFGNENFGGAKKLYESSRKYLEPYRPQYAGIALDRLFEDMECCFAELLACPNPFESEIVLRDELVPRIEWAAASP